MSDGDVGYALPPTLVGHADLARLVREVESIEDDLQSQKVRDETAAYQMPSMSQGLDDFLELNKIDVTDGHLLPDLKKQLQTLKDHAPIIHMTFAVEADSDSLEQLVAWLRQEIHPHTLLAVGLQPSLIGGVYMRTPNQVHDFSLKSVLAGKRDIIIRELEQLEGSIQ